jgi:hypothetical protein
MCVQDLLCINFSRNLRYDTISTYDTLVPSLFINQLPYQHFCGPCLPNTNYNTSTMPSLRILMWALLETRPAGDFSRTPIPNNQHLHQPRNGSVAGLLDPARWDPMKSGGGGGLQIWRRWQPEHPHAITVGSTPPARPVCRIASRFLSGKREVRQHEDWGLAD